jgi:PEP-CTERM motif
MKNSLSAALTACAVCGGFVASAHAAKTESLQLVLDTAQIVASGSNGYADGPFGDPFQFDLEAGDTLDLSISFQPGQTVTITGLSSIWAYAFGSPVTMVTGVGKFQFLDAAGSVLLESTEKTSTEGSDHFGQTFVQGDFSGLPASITFSGVRYVGTVVEYLAPGVTSRTYNGPGFAFDAVDFTTAVPEPASWALMLAGAGVLAAALRRRR